MQTAENKYREKEKKEKSHITNRSCKDILKNIKYSMGVNKCKYLKDT